MSDEVATLTEEDKIKIYFDMITIGKREDTAKIAEELSVERTRPYKWRKKPEFVDRLEQFKTGELGYVDFKMWQAEVAKCLLGDSQSIKHYRQYHKGWQEGTKVEHTGAVTLLSELQKAKEELNKVKP